jgi:hypothetical protein
LSEDSLIKQLMTSSQCEVCGRNFEEDDIVIMGNSAKMWVLKIFCSCCHSQLMMAALVENDKIVEPITDLVGFEFEKFKEIFITGDEVLDMHNLLKNFDGNFSELF